VGKGGAVPLQHAITSAVTDKDSADGRSATVRFTFLGTGSAVPSKYRNGTQRGEREREKNPHTDRQTGRQADRRTDIHEMTQGAGGRLVSATLVEASEDVDGPAWLLDCGEGTLAQLHRARGDAAATAVLGRLRAVLVSHLHADHHLGLLSILQARHHSVHAAEAPTPLWVIAPAPLEAYLIEMAAAVPLPPWRFVDADRLRFDSRLRCVHTSMCMRACVVREREMGTQMRPIGRHAGWHRALSPPADWGHVIPAFNRD
jgi:hypothetical protein